MINNNYLYVISVVFRSVFISISSSILTIYLLDKGFMFTDIGIYFSIFLFLSMISEYPSGILADSIGRKKTYCIGLIFTSLTYLLFSQDMNMYILICMGVFGGISDAMISGSLEAWISHNNDNNSVKIITYTRSISIIVSIVAMFIYGYLSVIDNNNTYMIMSLITLVISIALLLLGRDNTSPSKFKLMILKESSKEFLNNSIARIYSIILGISMGSYSIFLLFWQVFAEEHGIIGNKKSYVYSVYLIAAAISSYIFIKVNGIYLNTLQISIISLIVSTIGLFFIKLDSVEYFILGVFIFGLGMGVFFPILYDVVNNVLQTKYKASLYSLFNGIGSLFAMICTIIGGYIIDNYGIKSGVDFGISTLLVSLFILIIKYNDFIKINNKAVV